MGHICVPVKQVLGHCFTGLDFYPVERYFYPTMGRNIGKKGRNGILPGRKGRNGRNHPFYQSNVHGIRSFLV